MEKLRKEKEIREKGTLEVYDKISEKKRLKRLEEERLAKELKEIKLQRQYLNASKAMVEEKAWKDLENGAERIAREKQNDALLDQCKDNGTKVKELSIRAANNRTEIQGVMKTNNQFTKNLETKRGENEVLHK
jgi:thiamine kinase-like enzyme